MVAYKFAKVSFNLYGSGSIILDQIWTHFGGVDLYKGSFVTAADSENCTT